MTEEERNKVFELRCESKSGKKITKEELAYLIKMYKKFPLEYSAMNDEVFQATKPFGSNILN